MKRGLFFALLLCCVVGTAAFAGSYESDFTQIVLTEAGGEEGYVLFQAADGTDIAKLSASDADANAECFIIDLPEGGSTVVPVVILTLADSDFGYFAGTTQPLFAIEDADGDSWISISFSSDDTPAIEVGGAASTIAIPNISGVTYSDDIDLGLGTTAPVSFEYTTADANANLVILDTSAGDATDVPGFGIVTTDADLGYFNSYTAPFFFVEDDDGDSFVSIEWLADDVPSINIGGTATYLRFIDGVDYGVDGTGVDVQLYGDTAGNYLYFDQDIDALVAVDIDLKLDDDTVLYFGTGTNVTTADGDFTMNFTDGAPGYLTVTATVAEDVFQIGDGTIATDVLIQNTTTAGADIFWDDSGELWKFGADNVGVDVGFYGDTAGDFILFDEDADELIVEDITVNLMDDTILSFGDADDVTIQYDEDGNNDLQITGTVGFDGTVNFGIDATGVDVHFFGDTTLYQAWFDQNADTNGSWFFGDDDYGIDVWFRGVTVSQGVQWDAGTDTWFFGADAEGVDVHFRGDTTLYQVWWDENADTNGSWFFGDDDYGVDVVFSGVTSGTFAKWDASADDFLFGTASNYTKLDETGVALLGTAGAITSVTAGVTYTTNTTKTHKFAYGGIGYIGATDISTTGFISSEGLAQIGLAAGVAEVFATEGYTMVDDVADMLYFSFSIPPLFIDNGATGDLVLEFDLHEQGAEECNIDIRIFEYGNTTPIIIDTVVIADSAARGWSGLVTLSTGIGADGDIGADDLLMVELTVNAAGDDVDVYGIRLKYNVGIEATQ